MKTGTGLHEVEGMEGDQVDVKKWAVLYPVYMNSKKTVAQGRRIATSAACEDPTCDEIGRCCSYLHLPNVIEIDKAYPRDFMQRGRVRVQLKKDDGAYCNTAITSRKQLMIKVAELVPKLQSRGKKQDSSAASISTTSSKSGKGGRRKK